GGTTTGESGGVGGGGQGNVVQGFPEPASAVSARLKLVDNSRLTPQIGWLYPLALLSLVAGLVRHRGSPRTDRDRAGYLMWGTWLLTAAGVLSAIDNLFHTAYVAELAPPLAALSAAGTVALWREHRAAAGGPRGCVLPAVLVTEVGWTLWLASDHTGFAPWLVPLVAVAALCAVLALTHGGWTGGRRTGGPWAPGRIGLAGLLAGCLAMFAAPAAWSLSVLNERYAGSAFDASAGPRPAGPGTGTAYVGGPGATGSLDPDVRTSLTADERELLAYVEKHNGRAKYPLSTETWPTAAPFVYAEGLPVLSLAGSNGAEPVSLARYRRLVATGALRHALVGGGNGLAKGTEAARISAWVRSACAEVDPGAYGAAPAKTAPSAGVTPQTLYRFTAADATAD
ncbi:hypothetical protein OK074_4419, partial [Actinobacteria bacterium OK074]